jgi:hypothetical protein
MKVQLRVGVSHEGKRHNSGDLVEVKDDVAKLWIGLRFAEPANAEKARQKAVRRAPATATKQAAPAAAKKAAPARRGPAKKK